MKKLIFFVLIGLGAFKFYNTWRQGNPPDSVVRYDFKRINVHGYGGGRESRVMEVSDWTDGTFFHMDSRAKYTVTIPYRVRIAAFDVKKGPAQVSKGGAIPKGVEYYRVVVNRVIEREYELGNVSGQMAGQLLPKREILNKVIYYSRPEKKWVYAERL